MSPKKIIVAVHGIGDQVEFATVQSVANRVYDYCNPRSPFTIPLGRFHSALKVPALSETQKVQKAPKEPEKPRAYFPEEPDPSIPDPSAKSTIGFSEVYWADICRKPAKEGYTLEEARDWVKTMVNRIQRFDDLESAHRNAHNADSSTAPRAIDYGRIELVLNEMIDTVNVVERLISLLVKMNLIKPFQLKTILNDYLGDVQFVAEFVPIRDRIIARFNETLEAVEDKDGDYEIYFVSHSEGTVVTFLSLLRALSEPHPDKPRPEWISHVKGLMTIGSPIDKHLILWPELWPSKNYVPFNEAPRIKWWNYFDKGDPVGFELDTAVTWMKCHGWDQVFDLSGQSECGFTRYPLPGKAHNDYWKDIELFDHFLGDVVMPRPSPKPPLPKTKRMAQVVSYIAPYLVFAALLIASIYVLHKGVTVYFGDSQATKLGVIGTITHVLGLSFLVAGVTVVARIPRLTRRSTWHVVACFIFLATAGIFVLTNWTYSFFTWKSSLTPYMTTLKKVDVMPAFITNDPFVFSLVAVGLGAVVAGLAFVISLLKPDWRMKPLIACGAIALGGLVVARVQNHAAEQALWPLLLAFAAFCLLWWTAALCFDLAFVWHFYIRWSVATNGLRNRHWAHMPKLEPESSSPANATDSGAATKS